MFPLSCIILPTIVFSKSKLTVEMSSLADLLEKVDHISLNDRNRVVCSITGENDVGV